MIPCVTPIAEYTVTLTSEGKWYSVPWKPPNCVIQRYGCGVRILPITTDAQAVRLVMLLLVVVVGILKAINRDD